MSIETLEYVHNSQHKISIAGDGDWENYLKFR